MEGPEAGEEVGSQGIRTEVSSTEQAPHFRRQHLGPLHESTDFQPQRIRGFVAPAIPWKAAPSRP